MKARVAHAVRDADTLRTFVEGLPKNDLDLALLHSASHGSVSAARLLIARGADVNYRKAPIEGPYGQISVLQNAVGSKSQELLKVLFENKVNPLDGLARPPTLESHSIRFAVEVGDYAVLTKLLNYIRSEFKTAYEVNVVSAFRYAVIRGGRDNVALQLVKEYPEVFSKTRIYRLKESISKEDWRKVKSLVEVP
jgi:hypothetical protein